MENLVRYRFQPKDEEIITIFNNKKLDPDFSVQTIKEVDIYNFEPFDLPRLSAIQSNELVWYFFCSPYSKHSNSKRANRRTSTGYWKLTGKGCKIFAKHCREVIDGKNVLIFYEHGAASTKRKAEWVMREFRSEYNSPCKKGLVICRIERKTYNKPKISTGDDHQLSHHLACKFKNHTAENNFPTVATLQLPGHMNMTYDFRNHVAENSSSRVEPQQLPSHYLHFDSRNHVAAKTVQVEESQLLPNQQLASNSRNHVAEKKFSGVEYQLPHQCLTSDYRNHVAENTLPMVECQQLPSHSFNSTSDYRNHVAENIYLRDEYKLLLSHYLASNSRNHVAENSFPWYYLNNYLVTI